MRPFLPRIPRVVAGLFCCFGVTATAQAADSDYLTGDWGGERARLASEGVQLNVNYTGEAANNPKGGDRELTRYTGQLAIDVALDLEKLWGWQGAKFQLSITDRGGRNLSDDAHLGALQQVQEVYGRNQTWRLTQMWYSQDLFGDHLNVKLGRLTVGADFASFECNFMNLTFCGAQPGNIVGNYWYNWPVSQWAVVFYSGTSADTYLKLGVYQVNPAYLLTRNTIRPNFPAGTTGALIPVEFGWTPTFSDDLDGSFKLGGWYNTSHYSDVRDDILGGSQALSGLAFEQRSGAYGGYLSAEQQITHGYGNNPKSGLRTFFNVTQADRGTSTVDRQIAMGLTYTGPFASRPADDIGFAIGTTHVNSRVAQRERELNLLDPGSTLVQGSEYTTEVYYTWKPVGWLSLRPNLQYIRHPGGTSANDDAMVVGLKFGVAL
jgi:porin